jgi:hypothetical protein
MRNDTLNNDLTNRTDSEPGYTGSVPSTPIKRFKPTTSGLFIDTAT